jgi:hypothetical protein
VENRLLQRSAVHRHFNNADFVMAETAPRTSSVHPAHAYGRLTLWLVLALMAGAAIFAIWIALSNFSSIRV